MKVVILAAGKGTRMLPLTEKKHKLLIEVNGRPFLYYVLKSFERAGYHNFGLIAGHKKEQIARFLKEYGFAAELIEQKEPKGTGHALLQARPWVGNEDFIAIYGDNLWSVEDFKAINIKDDYHYVTGFNVKDWRKYGILIVEGDLLAEIREKPPEFAGNLINSGLFKFKPEIFRELEKVKPSPRGEIEITDAVTALAKERKVKVLQARWWLDLGCPGDVEKVSNFLKDNWEE